MDINLNSRWGKWFLFSLWDSDTRRQYVLYDKKTNLCKFIQVCLIMGPLKVLFPIAATVVLLYIAFQGGFLPGLIMIAVILSVMAMFATIVGLILGFHYLFTNTLSDSVLGQYVKAKKNKYCPLITFTKQETNDQQGAT